MQNNFWNRVRRYPWYSSILLGILLLILSLAIPGDNLSYELFFWRVLDCNTTSPGSSITSVNITDIKAADIIHGGEKEIIATVNVIESTANGIQIPHAELHVIGAHGGFPLGWERPRPSPEPKKRKDFTLEEIYEIGIGHFIGRFVSEKEIFLIARDLDFGDMRLIHYFADGQLGGVFTATELNSLLEELLGGGRKLDGIYQITTFKGISIEDMDDHTGNELIIIDNDTVDILHPVPTAPSAYPYALSFASIGFLFQSNQEFLTSMAIGDVNNDGKKDIVLASSLGLIQVFTVNITEDDRVVLGGGGFHQLNLNLNLRDLIIEQDKWNHYITHRQPNLVIGDIDVDGKNEIIYLIGGNIYIFEVRNESVVQDYHPIPIPNGLKHIYDQKLFLGNIEGDERLEIFVTIHDDERNPLNIYGFRVQWILIEQIEPHDPNNHFISGLLGNLDDDNKPDLVLCEDSDMIDPLTTIYKNTSIPNARVSFDKQIIEPNTCSPLISDLDNNDSPEVIFGQSGDQLVGWNFQGIHISEWTCIPHDERNTWYYPTLGGERQIAGASAPKEKTKRKKQVTGEIKISILDKLPILSASEVKKKGLFITSQPEYKPKPTDKKLAIH